jgi:hypothetical protein
MTVNTTFNLLKSEIELYFEFIKFKIILEKT